MSMVHRLMCLLGVIVMLFGTAELARGEYVAGTWSDTAVHFLDNNLADTGSFPAGSTNPNGIATDGSLIYTGHFTTQEVIAYDFSGVEQFRWSASLSGLQGMELVNGELAVANGGLIEFYTPATGVFNRSIPSAGGSVEGLAFDGIVLWQLDSGAIVGISPADGSVVSSLPNAASGCTFGGTGITASAPGELTLACTNGDWFQVSSADGSVLASGNNGLDMFALKFYSLAPPPAPSVTVPTMNEWGMILFVILSGLGAVYFLRKKKLTS